MTRPHHDVSAWLQQAERLLQKAKRMTEKARALRKTLHLADRPLSEGTWGRFSEELGRLLEGGVPLLEALAFLAGRSERRVRELAEGMGGQLRAGNTLSESMHRERAPLLVLALVQAGEHNGDLAGNLARAAASCAQRETWRRERQQAMAYPFFLCLLLLGLLLFLFEVIIPRFADLYAGMGVHLGATTRMMFALGRHDFLVLTGLLAGAALLFFTLRRCRRSLPVFRHYDLLDRTHQWTITLGVLVEGGLPLLQALEIQSNLALPADSTAVSKRVSSAIRQGFSLSTALLHEPFENSLLLSVQVAEATGDLGRSLLAAATDLAARRKQRMDLMLKMFEPLLLLVVGGFVGVVALFLFWPMLDLLQSI
ncbi:type II secretion system F family protein [Tumebacillus flagellatus]|uniref:Type II secretion system protein GspF domain-containing protein n=1 Tax=Tumebacillus flagellatus TaxID=1157490 RepID=A0A074LSA6_9BACL|nr:type II secretion system F family protein [Tumebacillus flagellatus]KEO82663.1 hypothetical protein EL26_13940 [Tumebacillus flagellatus]